MSHTESADIDPAARDNRLLLREIMMASGFKPYYAEWWHFTLADEPYPQTYFDVTIDK